MSGGTSEALRARLDWGYPSDGSAEVRPTILRPICKHAVNGAPASGMAFSPVCRMLSACNRSENQVPRALPWAGQHSTFGAKKAAPITTVSRPAILCSLAAIVLTDSAKFP